ncbi:MAG: UDP-N-acetylglucosamine--LPS N-acetylglucosamine transferase [Pseudomonadota bacterium]
MTYVSTNPEYRAEIDDATDDQQASYRCVTDASRWNKLRLLRQASEIALLIIRNRPDVIVTTGAAPGYFAIRLGKLLGARTAWIDSIANAEELSMSGRMAGKHADLWLTQWPHLASANGPKFMGAVI